ncbi:MAG: carbon-nitrogen hydrolase family protein [Xanthobacteraceae bacterium]
MGQMLVEGGEPERNLVRAEQMIEKGAQAGAHCVLLPECLDLGWTHPSALTEAAPIPGPRSDRLIETAKRNKVYLCAGLTELDGDRVYNSAIFSDPDGNLLLKYRKINELAVGHPYYALGRSLSVVETPIGNIGVNICADNYSDSLELGHALGRMGAQIILSPSSWTVDYSVTEDNEEYREKWLRPYQTLTSIYNMVIVSVTSVGVIVGGPYEGKKMVGCSLVVGEKGVLFRGKYNEFAGALSVVDFEIPHEHEYGTLIGDMLKRKKYVHSYA